MKKIVLIIIALLVLPALVYAVDVEERVGVDVMSSYTVVDVANVKTSANRNVYVNEGGGFYLLYEDSDFENQFDKVLKSFALVILDEINALRTNASLAERSVAQLKTAVKNKYDAL